MPVRSGSFPLPVVTVKGAPVVLVTILPSSHPPMILDTIAEEDFGDGICKIKVPTKTCRISKSQAPDRVAGTRRRGTAMEFRYVSPVTGAELRSWHLPSV